MLRDKARRPPAQPPLQKGCHRRAHLPTQSQGRSARAGGRARAQAGHQRGTGGQGQRAGLPRGARPPTGRARAAVPTVPSAACEGERGPETRVPLGGPPPGPPGSRGTRAESGLRTHVGPSGRRFLELSVKAGGAGSQRLPRRLGAQGPVLGVGRSCVLTPHDARSTDEQTQVKGCVAHGECGAPRPCSALAVVWPGTSSSRPSVSPSSSVKGVTPPPRLRGCPAGRPAQQAWAGGARGEAGAQSAPGPGPHRTPEQAGAGGLPPEPPEPPEPGARRHRPAVRTLEPRHAPLRPRGPRLLT